MNNKLLQPQSVAVPENPDKLKSINGFVTCLITAVTAELVFEVFPNIEPQLFSSFGRLAVVFLSLYTVHRFAQVSFRRYKPGLKDFFLMHLVLIGSILLVGLGRFLANALSTYAETSLQLGSFAPESLHYAIPYAAGGLLVQAVLGLQCGLVFSLSFALIVGIYSVSSPIILPYVLIANLVGCLSMSRFRSRSAFVRAGFNIAIVLFPFALASIIAQPNPTPSDIVVRLVGAFFAGALCTFIAGGVTPILEYLGGYVTDMRLIEMATLDHPLLKELSIQAPGTWNHSMVMGMMAESAADSIGANPVLARVGAYFHDIGKMKKPLYFVENQVPGDNRHDKLSSSMSALIIRSHVKDGIELAQQHKLPTAIIDMIPQHHGTSVIEYFYEKAVKEAEEAEDDVEVDKSLYSYPGPKPQTREAGILLIADGIEAAARTLSEPSQDRIQGMVQKMINKVFSSGQLSECDLTLRDLHEIAKCFTRVLTGIYHQRIAYFEPAEKVSGESPSKSEGDGKEDEETEEAVAGNGLEQSEESDSDDSEDEGKGREDLKRLGL